jgi:hypothetical protein
MLGGKIKYPDERSLLSVLTHRIRNCLKGERDKGVKFSKKIKIQVCEEIRGNGGKSVKLTHYPFEISDVYSP